jgi:pyridoxal phosphate-dependent aminotransferase EpsN
MYFDPMSNDRIYLSPPRLEGNERKYLLEALDSNWIAPTGPFVTRLEQALREHTGMPEAIAVNSGTSAIHLALRVLGVGPGDEVICPTFTFIASAAPATYLGASPVFVDCEMQTWNMDPELLDQAIRSRRAAGAKVKAVVFAYCYGMPGRMDEILEICRRHELPLIEDAAEALGSTYKGKPAGTLGDIGIYSFNGNKIVTGSVGGAVVCRDLAISARIRKLVAQAKENTPHFEHHEIGYNYGMSNLVAAVVLGQLEMLEKKVSDRRKVFDGYVKQLRDTPGVRWQVEIDGCRANRWLSAFFFGDDSGIRASELIAKLASQNIESRPLWKPLHLQGAFTENLFFGDDAGGSEVLAGVCLPSLKMVHLD